MEPLANKIRPKTLEEFVGQEHLVGPGKPLRVAIEKATFSFILWVRQLGENDAGPHLCNALDAEFYEISAVDSGKEDIKRIVGEKGALDFSTKPKILFIDEIHRFNKTQQDFLLPYVERGELTLIGAPLRTVV